MTESKDQISRITELLDEQLGLFTELSDEMAAQKRAVLEADTTALQTHADSIERLSRLMKGVDRKRRRHLDALGRTEHVAQERLTISWLKEHANGPQKRKLTMLNQELRSRIRHVDQHGKEIKTLLDSRIKFNRMGMEWLMQADRKNKTYDSVARVKNNTPDSRIIDRKV
jgi:hypothetical protein